MKEKYNGEDIYFIKYRGEIYECKFKSILVKVGRQETIIANIQEGIIQVSLNVASIGTVPIPYASWISRDDWDAVNIYSTLQDCMTSRNPLFFKVKESWAFSEALPYYYKDIRPSNAHWIKNDKDSWVLRSFRYDTETYSAVQVNYQAHSELTIPSNRTKVPINFPTYDVINKTWWGDLDYLEKLFATEADCMACSAPKIHRFS